MSGLLTLLAAGVVALAFLRGRGSVEAPAAYDLRVYKDQLAEVDRDLARGVLSQDEAERARTEVKRRILDADRALAHEAAETNQGGAPRAMAVAALLGIAGAGFGIYWQLGAPGYPDMPLTARIAASDALREARPSQADAEARIGVAPAPTADLSQEYQALLERLREAVATRPDDLEGHVLLAENEAGIGNYVAAHAAQARVIEIKGAEASGDDYARLADLMVLATGGYVSPEAERALTEALSRDPSNGPARFYSGLFYTQIGRPDLAFRVWRQLIETSPEDAPWMVPLRSEIQSVAFAAGVDYTPPPVRGPSTADMVAAAEMSPEDRDAMIRGMVEGLSQRLAEDGGPSEDWARLITALGVLGETGRAKAIYDEALQVFAASEADLAAIRTAGQRAGFAE